MTIGLAVAGFVGAHLLGELDARRESEHRAEVAAAQIRGRVEQGAELAESLRRAMAGTEGRAVTNPDFERIVARYLSPAGFPAAAWVERVPASRRATYERRTGHPIVTRDRQGRLAPAGSRSSYLPARLVSGTYPMAVPGTDLGGEPRMAPALSRASTLYDGAATPLATLRDGTKGLFLIRLAPRFTRRAVEPGFVVVFASERSLRAAGTDTPGLQLAAGGSSTVSDEDAAAVRRSFTAVGQRFDVVVPQESVQGAAAVLPWIILAAGLVLAALAGALRVNAARRAKAQADLDRIYRLTPDLIAVADFEGHFMRVNPAVEQVLGYTQEEFLARPYLELVHPEDRQETTAEASAIEYGKTTLAFENRYLHKDGSYRVLEWTSAPVVEDGQMYGVARDVTERRQAEAEVERLADEQAALRRVATLVAREASQADVFASIAAECGRLFGSEDIVMVRYENDRKQRVVASSGTFRDAFPAGSRQTLGGEDAASRVFETERPFRIDDYAMASGAIGEAARSVGVRSVVATPIVVEGRLWGTMITAARNDDVLAPETESRLAQFTDLMATAIANTESRAEVERLAEEQAALRRVATLVAHGAPPAEVFASVAEEVGQVLGVDFTLVSRYEDDRAVEIVGGWSRAGPTPFVGAHSKLGGNNVSTLVFERRAPARVDHLGDDAMPTTALARDAGARASAGAPIPVEGRLWGVMVVAEAEEGTLPVGIEHRLAAFTEIVATAIANAEGQAELMASRARVVASADETRRRIERDLHDGVQQRLVSLGLQLGAARAAVPPGLDDLSQQLDRIAAELDSALDELLDFARGIHPRILARGGLGAALGNLARHSPVQVNVDVRAQDRLPEPVEVAAYFFVSEALTNASKHAQATCLDVEVEADADALRVGVHDDGVGGAQFGGGSGLVGLRDRVEALGGRISLQSKPGAGTSIRVVLPLSHDSAAG